MNNNVLMQVLLNNNACLNAKNGLKMIISASLVWTLGPFQFGHELETTDVNIPEQTPDQTTRIWSSKKVGSVRWTGLN